MRYASIEALSAASARRQAARAEEVIKEIQSIVSNPFFQNEWEIFNIINRFKEGHDANPPD